MAIYKKQVETSTSIKKEASNLKSINNDSLLFTLADRTLINEEATNLFTSFNLPQNSESFLSGGSLATVHPELYQLNTDKALFIEVQGKHYDEFINGKSITLKIPVTSAADDTIMVYSTFYSIDDPYTKTSSSSLLGNNVSFLFSDVINKPYTGSTNNGSSDRSSVATWGNNISDVVNRPAAVAYHELEQNDKNSDDRSIVDMAIDVPLTDYPSNLDTGYNYDIPVGFASLDKGYFVITHPSIVDNIDWTAGTKNHIDDSGLIISDGAYTGGTKTHITFPSAAAASPMASFRSVKNNYTTSVLCLAMPQEFFISTNPTWNLDRNLEEVENETYDLDPIYVTQVGLYNAANELVAVAKLNTPIEKTYTKILTFSLNLEV